MSKTRGIHRISTSRPTIEGAGVHLKRAFGFHHVPRFDPFLLLDDFHSDNPSLYEMGFPWHPHRGIETITYMITGTVEHGDSMENAGVIREGDVQWMTAGSGIVHQEMPRGARGGMMWGLQLWANLPASQKMMSPRYREVKDSQIPEVTLDNGVRVKVISGEVDGVSGPVKDIVIEPEYLDVTVPANTRFERTIKEGHTAFAYVLDGKGYFCEDRKVALSSFEPDSYFDLSSDCIIGPENLVLYEKNGMVSIHSADSTLRFLLISGKPIREPVAWYGPIVMNTESELRTAFEEYRNGTFIK